MVSTTDSTTPAQAGSHGVSTGLPRRLLPVLLLGALLLVVAVNLVSGPANRDARPVRLAPVEVEPIEVDVIATGNVEPRERLEVRYPYASARVAQVFVEAGEPVEAGTPLVSFDEAPLAEAFRQARSEYLAASHALAELESGRRETELETLRIAVERAKRELALQETRDEQYQTLFESGLVSKLARAEERLKTESARLALEQSELAFAAAAGDRHADQVSSLRAEVAYRETALARAEARHQARLVRAPGSGTVIDVPAVAGMALTEGDVIVTLADMRSYRVRAMVDELEAGNLAIGQTVFVRSEYFGAIDLEGRIERIVPIVRPHRGVPSVEVVVALDPPTTVPPPPDGLDVDLRIRIDRATASRTVPIEAIVERGGKNVVFVVARGKAFAKPVVLGLRSESRVEVLDGLEPGDHVVIGGHTSLDSGESVVPVTDGGTGALRVDFFNGP